MTRSSITQFMDSVQDFNLRRSLSDGVRYRKKIGKSTEEILDWLDTQHLPAFEKKEPIQAAAESKLHVVRELSNDEIPQHKIDAVILEMQGLQTADLVSSSGVRIERSPKAAESKPIVEAVNTPLVIRSVVLFLLIASSTTYLVLASLDIYDRQYLPTILLEVGPLAVLFFARSRLIKVGLSLAYGICGVGALFALHSGDVSKVHSLALDTNPEYKRVSSYVRAMQEEIDGMPKNYRKKRDEKREEMKPLTDRLTEIEKAAKGTENSKAGEIKSDVKFVARILIFLGSLVFVHALSETLNSLNMPRLRRRALEVCR